MFKVIQNIRLELHRGREVNTSDPYLYRRGFSRMRVGRLKKTLDTGAFLSRCSSTYINKQKIVRLVGFSSASLLVLLTILSVAPITHETKSAEAIDGTESQTTITLTKASADLSLTTVSSDGTFASSTTAEQAKFGVTTTNYTGYTLTIAASDDAQTLVNSDTSITTHNTFSTITSVIDEKTFDDSSYNGYWGYKPSKMNSTTNVGFWPSPTTSATTLDVTEEANPSTANNYTIVLGARADYNQATGTYSKTMVLSATANPANYSVTYRDNTSDATVKNLPDATTSTTSGTSITLSSVTPSRTGYVFKGWCTSAPTDSGKTCSGTLYNAGGTYPIDQTTANTITLYATWDIPTYDMTIKTSTGISSVTLNGTNCSSASGCIVSGLTYGQSYTLTATLNDGYSFAAWSQEGPGSISNITTASTTFTVGEGEATITAVAAGAAAQAVKVNFAAAGSGTVGISSVTFKQTSTGTTVGTVSTSGGTVKLEPGVGYTITANATGIYGVSTYNGGTGPYALNNASYGTLTSTTTNPTYFTPNSSSSSAIITVTSCIKTISGTMQTYTTAMNQLCDDATGTLSDSRETSPTKSYKVGVVVKANNGGTTKLWMTQNLSIGCNGSSIASKTLTSSTSNVSSNYTTPTTSGHSNDYTNGKVVCSSTDTGAWYNYAAASAGTITGDSNNNAQTYDICPKGWRLPNHNEIASAASNMTSFSPVAGGYYNGGTLYAQTYGFWWSSHSGSTANRCYLEYNGSYLYTGYSSRLNGFYVRCVRSA